ncbi:putative dehydrogenase [Triangularia verruculosa]|uniref:Dehydrogenase n=1 Tax=Triangularia verruculosa TaxID=2587418 RepID=A0AAN6XD83_9PEZI|nr:putative dehydrogenase [Triangularia verruculosa]
MMSPKTYLITGTTSGIGLALVKHLLSQSQNVIATGRNITSRFPPSLLSSHPNNLKLLELDLTAPLPTLQSIAASAWALFPGGIDILFNNAGMSAMKSCEEASDDYITTIFTANLFGPMRLTQALLPLLRTKSTTTNPAVIAFTSSSTAWTPLPFMSHYASSKAALSTYIEALAKELAPFGVGVVGFECGGCATNLGQPREETTPNNNSSSSTTGLLDQKQQQETVYDDGLAKLVGMFTRDPMAYMPGDADKVARTMAEVVQKLNGGEKVPSRVVLGSDAWESVKQKVEETAQVLEDWKAVSWGTDREGVKGGCEADYLRAVSIL